MFTLLWMIQLETAIFRYVKEKFNLHVAFSCKSKQCRSRLLKPACIQLDYNNSYKLLLQLTVYSWLNWRLDYTHSSKGSSTVLLVRGMASRRQGMTFFISPVLWALLTSIVIERLSDADRPLDRPLKGLRNAVTDQPTNYPLPIAHVEVIQFSLRFHIQGTHSQYKHFPSDRYANTPPPSKQLALLPQLFVKLYWYTDWVQLP